MTSELPEPLRTAEGRKRALADAKRRIEERKGKQVKVATLYVTHDQVEAMTMGDRVAVLRAGRLQQYAPPTELYDHPANLFVAAFIGSPAMNLYQGVVDSEGRSITLGDQTLALPAHLAAEGVIGPYRGRNVVVGIRPEDLGDAAARDEDSGAPQLHGTVELVEELGAEKLVHFRMNAERLSASDELLAGVEEEAESGLGVGEIGTAAASVGVARLTSRSEIAADQAVSFTVDTSRLQLFDPEAGVALRQD